MGKKAVAEGHLRWDSNAWNHLNSEQADDLFQIELVVLAVLETI